MASNSNGVSTRLADTENSLEKIKRQLASGSGRNLLKGPLLKRSETLRKWNERWVILDPTTGKMEYRTRRNEPIVKGTIFFDANSTITISPVNFHGLSKYEGCCFYIGTPPKHDYFLCAETPGAARAWVSTLHASQLVLKVHNEAVNSLSGSGSASAKLGTIAAVVSAANSIAMESSKEIQAAMQISLRSSLMTYKEVDGPLDDLSVMRETLRVKDEELQNLARQIRARDATIRDIAEKLSETAEAAEAAAMAARTVDEHRRVDRAEMEQISRASEQQRQTSQQKLKEHEEKIAALSKERDQAIEERDSALQEAHLYHRELAEATGRAATLEADARLTMEQSVMEKQKLLAYVSLLHSQLHRHGIELKQASEEEDDVDRTRVSFSGEDDTVASV